VQTPSTSLSSRPGVVERLFDHGGLEGPAVQVGARPSAMQASATPTIALAARRVRSGPLTERSRALAPQSSSGARKNGASCDRHSLLRQPGTRSPMMFALDLVVPRRSGRRREQRQPETIEMNGFPSARERLRGSWSLAVQGACGAEGCRSRRSRDRPMIWLIDSLRCWHAGDVEPASFAAFRRSALNRPSSPSV